MAQDDFDDDIFPVSLYVDLGNSTNPSSADATNLFANYLEAFGNGSADHPDDQVPTTPPLANMTLAPPSPPPVKGIALMAITRPEKSFLSKPLISVPMAYYSLFRLLAYLYFYSGLIQALQ
jgi:hypothetical protein